MDDAVDNGFFESLVNRVFRLLGLRFKFLQDSRGEVWIDIDDDTGKEWSQYRKLNRNEMAAECIESVCRAFLEERYVVPQDMIPRGKPTVSMFGSIFLTHWIYLKGRGLDNLISNSFSELDMKLSLRGV